MAEKLSMRLKHSFRRPKHFVRRELKALNGGLTLICCCAGSGKTALLSQLADENKKSVCICAGAEDNSVRRFTSLLSEALPEAGITPDDGGYEAVSRLVSVLSKDLGRPLLIDDADVFTDSGASSMLRLLAQAALEYGFSMVTASRSVPSALLPFVMEGDAHLLGGDALRLSLDEAVSLARSIRKEASEENIRQLHSYTGGWCIAMSELLRTGIDDPDRAADCSLLQEYISGSILDGLDGDMHQFFLISALLQGDEELYRDGLGMQSAGVFRQRLVRMGIAGGNENFISYPQVLRHILSGILPAEQRNELMERASDHYISEKRFAEAVQLFEVSGNARAAERLLQLYGDKLLTNCEFELIGYCGRIIGSLTRVRSPEALGALAQYYYYNSDHEKMEQAFNLADSMFGKENRFSVLRKLYNGLIRYELKPALYSENVISAVNWLSSNGLQLPFLYSRERDILSHIMNSRDDSTGEDKLSVRRFGSLRLTAGERHTEIQCRTKRSAEIIAYILENGGKPVARDELLSALWQEDMPANAVAMLHNMIYHLRRELSAYGMENIISYKNRFYTLDTDMIEDADREIFEVCQVVQSGRAEELIKHEELLKSYWGSYLGSIDSPWANEKREYYDRCYVSACTMLAGHYREEGRLDDAVAMLKNAYRLDPYSEQLVYEMLSCYSASGKPDKAKSCYEEFCARLDAEFGTRPGKWLRNHFFSCFSDEAYQKEDAYDR